MTKQGGFGKPNSGLATICRFVFGESIRAVGHADSNLLFYPEQLGNEACPNHLHSSRATSVHDNMLWVRILSLFAIGLA